MMVSIGVQKRCNVLAMCRHTGLNRIIIPIDILSIATIPRGW
jgi:hypothetical protein